MPGMWWIVAAVAAVLVAAYVAWTAGRVDRLHARAAAAGRALEAHLLRRAAAAAVLAEAVLADPVLAGPVLAGPGAANPASCDAASAADLYAAARVALDAHPAHRETSEREAAENDLTRLLRAFPLDPGHPAAASVVAASRRVAVARQVHTDLVRDALGARRRPLVRVLRLARRHPRPAYFDIDDPTLSVPAGPVAVPVAAAAAAGGAVPGDAVPA
jgi:hypothetical protein